MASWGRLGLEVLACRRGYLFFQSAEKPRMVRHAECQACGLEAHAGIKAAEALLPELTSSTCAKKGIHEIKEE